MTLIRDCTCCLFIVFFLLLTSYPLMAQSAPPAKVTVSPVVRESVRDKVILIGTVEPWRSSTVAAEVSGRVDSLAVRRGETVKGGDILARLGKGDLAFRLDAARARKNATLVRLEKARDDLERSEKLLRRQAISAKEGKDARLAVNELEENLAATNAEIKQLEDELSKKTVKAPFNGIVTREMTEIGQWVDEGGDIIHLVDLSVVRILVDMPEKYVDNVRVAEEVTVKFDALPEKVYKGRVRAVIPEGNREAHLFPVEIHVKNKGLAIKAGMLARIEFGLGLIRSVSMVHKDAVITRGTRTYLFAVDQGTVKQVFVTTGQAKGELIEVRGPLKEGEMVVIRGNERIRNGQPVQVIRSER
jgi:membrane fusion protein (multidrug efflux system)